MNSGSRSKAYEPRLGAESSSERHQIAATNKSLCDAAPFLFRTEVDRHNGEKVWHLGQNSDVECSTGRRGMHSWFGEGSRGCATGQGCADQGPIYRIYMQSVSGTRNERDSWECSTCIRCVCAGGSTGSIIQCGYKVREVRGRDKWDTYAGVCQ